MLTESAALLLFTSFSPSSYKIFGFRSLTVDTGCLSSGAIFQSEMVLTFAQNLAAPRPLVRPLLPCFSISTPNSQAPAYFTEKRGSAAVGGKARVVAKASGSTSLYSPKIADDLGDVTIFTAAGEPVMFKDLWDQNEGLAVVALLRHFGCVCCWELASTLKECKSRFDSAGVKIIAVGVGTPNKARMLAERLPFPMDCLYADPERKAYNVLDLYYGVGRTFLNPASAKVFSRSDSFRKALKNYTIEATPDDISGVLQQGGMLVFKGRQLLYARKDEGTGDHAPLDDIFDICCKARSA